MIVLDKYGWSKNNVSEVLVTLGNKYKVLTQKGVMPNFNKSTENEEFFNKLKLKGYISKVIPKDNFLKVTTWKK